MADSSPLQYCIAHRLDDIMHERMSHACIACRYRPNIQTMGTSDNYLRDGDLRGPDTQPVGDRAPPCHPRHTNNSTSQSSILCHNGRIRGSFVFVLCPLNILAFKPTTAAATRESFVGGRQCCFHASIVSSQHRCADCKILIHVSVRSLTKDPCPQSLAISNHESAVSPHLNVSLYSWYQPVL